MNYKQVKRVVLAVAETIENNPGHINSKNLTERVDNLFRAVEADTDNPLDKIPDDALVSKEIENMTIELVFYHMDVMLKF